MRALGILAFTAILAGAAPAAAWWPVGHGILTRAALRALPEEVPPFFRSGAELAADTSFEPDVFKNSAVPALRDAEGPEHFLDLELLRGQELPAKRYAFLALCAQRRLNPDRVGLLPYAVTEGTERLAIALAEHRKWPQDLAVQARCLVYAGLLAHYAEDLCQPLHVTLDYDGRAGPDGRSPRTGIHERTDSLIERLLLQPDALAAGQRVQPFADLLPAVVKEIQHSRSRITALYALERHLPPTTGNWRPNAEVISFGTERARESVRFTAALYLTAWRLSERVRLPDWMKRGPAPAPSGATGIGTSFRE